MFPPGGDAAILIDFADDPARRAEPSGIDDRVNDRVHALTRILREHARPEIAPRGTAAVAGGAAILDLIPAYSSLLVCYDPRQISFAQMHSFLQSILQAPLPLAHRHLGGARNEFAIRDADDDARPPFSPRLVEIPTVYGGEFGPDLAFVAEHNGITQAEVIHHHTRTVYRVYMLGFVPGFAYLGTVAAQIAAPRLETPRTRVPAGSVAIAGRQTGVYPMETPGGWRLIGRTSVKLFDPSADPPALLRPGDHVRFASVPAQDIPPRRQG